jgi:hypothetical protein
MNINLSIVIIIMYSLHDAHEMNTHRADHVCLSVSLRMIQNHWTGLYEIWYGHYAFGVYPTVTLLYFLKSVIPTWQTNELVLWDGH